MWLSYAQDWRCSREHKWRGTDGRQPQGCRHSRQGVKRSPGHCELVLLSSSLLVMCYCMFVAGQILHRRNKAHALQVGIAGAINSLGKPSSKKTQQHQFSLFCQKTDGTAHQTTSCPSLSRVSKVFACVFSILSVGFHYDWEASYTVTDITSTGPADKILKEGDRIIKVSQKMYCT